MGLGAKEFYGNEKVFNTLNTLSADGDSTVSKAAKAEIELIRLRQANGGK